METFVREIELRNEKSLQIHQSEVGDEGCVVWDAALVLIKYLEFATAAEAKVGLTQLELAAKSVIELGCGTGAVGLTAAVFGANVLLTDLEDCLKLADLNIETNQAVLQGTAKTQALPWGSDVSQLAKPEIILVADCIYYEQSVTPLLKTLSDLCGPDTFILLSFEIRDTPKCINAEKEFIMKAKQLFHITTVPTEELHPEYQCSEILVLKLTRLAEGVFN